MVFFPKNFGPWDGLGLASPFGALVGRCGCVSCRNVITDAQSVLSDFVPISSSMEQYLYGFARARLLMWDVA
jgi:hypothetical protein